MARGKNRRGKSLFEELMDAPWQASIVIGAITFIGLKWVLPSIAGSNMFLKPVAQAFSELAWLFSGFFFVVGAIAFARTAASRKQAPRLKVVKNAAELVEVRPQGRQEPSIANPPPSGTQVRRGVMGEPMDIYPVWKEQHADIAPKSTAWSLEVIRDVEWKRFEDVCQKFYELSGIRSETTALGPDGGIDIRLYQDGSGRPTSIVQCKAWGERLVGVKPVRELLGVMTHEKIGKAFFMASGHFSDDAKQIASSNGITLINGEMLLMMIKRLPPKDQATLLSFATEGDYTVPTCPSCGIKMRRVDGTNGRGDFWGCHNYPRCRQKLGMRREAAS
jgi:restriction system protein